AAGISFSIEGDHLLLAAPTPPPSHIIEDIARHKSEILALLRLGSGSWSSEDWQAFFDERAAIAEIDGGLSQDDAESVAMEDCIVQWLCRNPAPDSPTDVCAECGSTAPSGLPLVPFLRGDGGHVWVHGVCHARWLYRRRAIARVALGRLGLHTRADQGGGAAISAQVLERQNNISAVSTSSGARQRNQSQNEEQ